MDHSKLLTTGTKAVGDTDTMMAITQRAYGSPGILRMEELSLPTIREKEVLVRVEGAGVDRGTLHLLEGKPYAVRMAIGLRKPRNPVPGLALAGIVEAVGPAVTRFVKGDAVYGVGKGSFAQFSVTKEATLAHRPRSITAAEAAAIPVSAVTALQGLRNAGRLRSGQHVLITGASGGVGSFAVQLAREFGAEVTGVCSAAKMDLVKELGAHHVVDYRTGSITDSSDSYDLIFDLAGSTPIPVLRRSLRRKGTLVVAGDEGGGDWIGVSRLLRAAAQSPFVSQRMTMLVSKDSAKDLDALRDLVDAGKIYPCLDRSFELHQASDALQYLASGQVRGKIVLTVPKR